MKSVKNKTTSTSKHNFIRIHISNIGVNIIKMIETNQELSNFIQRKWDCAESNSQGRSLPILKSANSILQYIGSDGSSPLKNLVLNMLTMEFVYWLLLYESDLSKIAISFIMVVRGRGDRFSWPVRYVHSRRAEKSGHNGYR